MFVQNFQKRFLIKGLAALPRSWVNRIAALRINHPALDRLAGHATAQLRNCDLEIQEGIGRGLQFNAGRSASSFAIGTWQAREQLALKAMLEAGVTFYDVGANVGFFAVIAARLLGPNGRVVCFEPLPENFRQIKYNALLNGFSNIEVVETALGNTDSEGSFWTSAEPTWGKLASAGKVPDKPTGEIRVPVRRLDRIVGEAGLPTPDVIKIDVEGAEADVLLGAADTIRTYRPRLLIELHGNNAAVADLLSEFGYKAAVIGESGTIADAPWNADVVAIPAQTKWPAGLPAASLKESFVGASA